MADPVSLATMAMIGMGTSLATNAMSSQSSAAPAPPSAAPQTPPAAPPPAAAPAQAPIGAKPLKGTQPTFVGASAVPSGDGGGGKSLLGQ